MSENNEAPPNGGCVLLLFGLFGSLLILAIVLLRYHQP